MNDSKEKLQISSNNSDKAPVAKSQLSVTSAKSRKQHKKLRRHMSQWEVIEGLKSGQRFQDRPLKHSGYIYVKRKWPLKGWRRKYCLLDAGHLTIAKSASELEKGRIRSSIDIGLCVIGFRKNEGQIDIDTEGFIYHLKIKDKNEFDRWLQILKHHRLFRQDAIAFGNSSSCVHNDSGLSGLAPPLEELTPGIPLTHKALERKASMSAQKRVADWVLDSMNASSNKGMNHVQSLYFELSGLLEQLEKIAEKSRSRPSSPDANTNTGLPHEKRKNMGGKLRFSFGRVKKAEANSPNSSCSNLLQQTPNSPPNNNGSSGVSSALNISNSSPEIALLAANRSPSNKDLLEQFQVQAQEEITLREEFLRIANQAHQAFRDLLQMMQTDKERLRFAMDQVSGSPTAPRKLEEENEDLRRKLLLISKICGGMGSDALALGGGENEAFRSLSAISEREDSSPSIGSRDAISESRITLADRRGIPPAKSLFSMNSEYHDAQEELSISECSEFSTEEDEEESLEEADETEDEDRKHDTPSEADLMNSVVKNKLIIRRSETLIGRETLPAPMPECGFSLWNFLSKNIGKDLSKVSMPVVVHEPLSALQVLCEELEYSYLLDDAMKTEDPYDRMALVAAFAVSAYASTFYRAERKPFNPLLGETFEYVRTDKKFKFIAEQVSHHPPISACHAEGRSGWTWWQDARVKIKFWGKSMEIQPLGTVQLELQKFGEEYSWNKLTTCIYNLFAGKRWVDQYGEMTITCSSGIKCRLIFEKANKNNNGGGGGKRHEVSGIITNANGAVILELGGRWTEGLGLLGNEGRCLWRPGKKDAVMPPDQEVYYGFTRFAMQLNEFPKSLPDVNENLNSDSTVKKYGLPPTDTRFRPDQRALEEGRVTDAERLKQDLEASQRERRKRREDAGRDYKPCWFSEEASNRPGVKHRYWRFVKQYWQAKEQEFKDVNFENLW